MNSQIIRHNLKILTFRLTCISPCATLLKPPPHSGLSAGAPAFCCYGMNTGAAETDNANKFESDNVKLNLKTIGPKYTQQTLI